jgi:hypothetical protein
MVLMASSSVDHQLIPPFPKARCDAEHKIDVLGARESNEEHSTNAPVIVIFEKFLLNQG